MADEKNHVAYIGLKLDADGDPIAYALTTDSAKAEEWSQAVKDRDGENEQPPAPPEKEAVNPLRRVLDRVVDTMMSYYALIDLGFQARWIFPQAYLTGQIVRPIADKAPPVASGDGWKVYGLSAADFGAVGKGAARLRRIDAGAAALPGSTLMSMVAAFDSVIADLVAALLKAQKEKLNIGEKYVPISEVLKANTIEEIIDRFVADQVYELLRGSHDEQVRYIEKTFDIDIRGHWRGWVDFIEIFERRNLLAHGEKSFTARYIDICGRHGKSVNVRKLGENIELKRTYLNHAADTLLEFGILLAFSLWRKQFREEEQEAFQALNEAAFRLISEGRSKVADNALRFAIGLKNTKCSELTRRMMVVNRANALRKLKKSEESEAVLNSMEWEAASDDFKICVAAVRGATEDVIRLMESVKNAGSISKESFRDWPVFDEVRTDETFRREYERVFNEPLVDEVKQQAVSSPTGIDDATTAAAAVGEPAEGTGLGADLGAGEGPSGSVH